MQAVSASVTRALPIGAKIETCDNSGAKIIQIISVKGHRTVKRRLSAAGVADMVTARVVKGKPEIRHQKVLAIIVRQKQEYRRANGERIKFADNSAVVLKDDKGNPKGTIFKGAIAKEVGERWPAIAKVAKVMV